jgi:hypothetical protein
MSTATMDEILETLEQSWVMLEGGQGEREQHSQAIQGCLALLLEHPPEAIVECARRSFLPTRALVSWMVFEAERMVEPGPSRARGLRACWQAVEATEGGSILPPPREPDALVH